MGDKEIDPAIRIVEYDPQWPALFEREALNLRDSLGDIAIRIDHVGSTAVPGLAAKLVIDVNVSVRDIRQVDKYRVSLELLGYLFVPNYDSPDLHFFGKPAERPWSFHVHVCEAGGYQERVHLVFRNYLVVRPAEAARYADLKPLGSHATPR